VGGRRKREVLGVLAAICLWEIGASTLETCRGGVEYFCMMEADSLNCKDHL